MKVTTTNEHETVQALDARRDLISGSAAGGYETISREVLVEVKTRRRIPYWLENALRQAERAAAEDKLPLALIGGEGTSRSDSLVVMRLKDFERLVAVEPEVEPEQVEKSVPKSSIEIFTDGGCCRNPGKGAWAAMVYEGSKPTEVSGMELKTTNNRMELRAAIEGLKQLKSPSRVKLYSDSAYLVNGMNQRWFDRWEQNGWKTASKKPVQNADLWRELVALSRRHDVKFVKIAGHAGIPANERCHALVQLAMSRRGKSD